MIHCIVLQKPTGSMRHRISTIYNVCRNYKKEIIKINHLPDKELRKWLIMYLDRRWNKRMVSKKKNYLCCPAGEDKVRLLLNSFSTWNMPSTILGSPQIVVQPTCRVIMGLCSHLHLVTSDTLIWNVYSINTVSVISEGILW